MTELSRQDVQQILELIEKSQFDYFELQSGDLKLTVSKTGLPVGSLSMAVPAPHAAPATTGRAPAVPPAPPAPAATTPSAPPTRSLEAARAEGLVPVPAPMVGTFYAQSEPGAPPYVQVGAPVGPESTLGLIEVMKVFNAVHPGVSGTVAEILVKNAEFVEFGQTLFLVRPDAAAA